MRLGYTGYNFETHTPACLTERRVFDAYCEFRDFTTEDRWFGMLGPTAILNHAFRREPLPLVKLSREGRHAGFHNKGSSYGEIVEQRRGKTLLNFDEDNRLSDRERWKHLKSYVWQSEQTCHRSIVVLSDTRPNNRSGARKLSRSRTLVELARHSIRVRSHCEKFSWFSSRNCDTSERTRWAGSSKCNRETRSRMPVAPIV